MRVNSSRNVPGIRLEHSKRREKNAPTHLSSLSSCSPPPPSRQSSSASPPSLYHLRAQWIESSPPVVTTHSAPSSSLPFDLWLLSNEMSDLKKKAHSPRSSLLCIISDQIQVPSAFPVILKDYCKEVIRHNPKDIAAFSRDYFSALASGGTKTWSCSRDPSLLKPFPFALDLSSFLGSVEASSQPVSDLVLVGPRECQQAVVEFQATRVAEKKPAGDV